MQKQLTGFGEFAEFGEFVEDFNPVFQPLDISTENLHPMTFPVFALVFDFYFIFEATGVLIEFQLVDVPLIIVAAGLFEFLRDDHLLSVRS